MPQSVLRLGHGLNSRSSIPDRVKKYFSTLQREDRL
jgi:hypothetical protein